MTYCKDLTNRLRADELPGDFQYEREARVVLAGLRMESARYIEELAGLLEEAHAELAAQADNEWQGRDDYPYLLRKWEQDMDLPNRIKKALDGGDP